MKTFIALLLGCLTLSAATLYPVMSTTTNRTIAPTSFGLQLLTNANAPELLTLISAAPSSNAVTLTGTQTISGAKSFTNAGNVFVGDGSGLTGVGGGGTNSPTLNGTNAFTGPNTFSGSIVFGTNSGVVGFHIWSLSSNVFLPTVVQTNTSATNAGGFANITALATITMPAARSPRSLYTFAYEMDKTNNTAGSTYVFFYGGTNTNFIGSFLSLNATTAKVLSPDLSSLLWCNHSTTNQIQGTSVATPPIVSPTNFVDTSAPWTLYIGLGASTGDSTNIFFRYFSITEKAYP